MNRKDFFKKTALIACALSTYGVVRANSKQQFTGDCETTNDILGPFYRKNAPVRQDLTTPNLTGNRIKIKGTVYTHDCKTPLENARVEIWHCDTKGKYDNDSAHYHQRAQWLTDNQGHYQFLSILPGKYALGEMYRPAHIHFRVTAPNHKELISQIYFKGDPHIDADRWASNPKAEDRILHIFPDDVKGDLSVQFDIYLGIQDK